MTATKQLASELREIYASDPSGAETALEEFLDKQVSDLPAGDRIQLVDTLCAEFDQAVPGAGQGASSDDQAAARLLSLILGREITLSDASSEDIMKRTAESFETIFGSLNDLVRIMNINLLGDVESEETIRAVIGSHLEGDDRLTSLEDYIERIKDTFLVIQKAFKNASLFVIKKILTEIDPEQISADTGTGLKIGPLRKAELFEIVSEKHDVVKKWLESGRCTEELLREFEKNCQKFSKEVIK
jgi:hypothetical protein